MEEKISSVVGVGFEVTALPLKKVSRRNPYVSSVCPSAPRCHYSSVAMTDGELVELANVRDLALNCPSVSG